jgi:hypothetical protein
MHGKVLGVQGGALPSMELEASVTMVACLSAPELVKFPPMKLVTSPL